MVKHAARVGVLILTLWGVAAVMAQAPAGPPQPGPEHKKLAYFVGKWTSEAELKPSPFGPGGKYLATETASGSRAASASCAIRRERGRWESSKGSASWAMTPGRKPIFILSQITSARTTSPEGPWRATRGPGTQRAIWTARPSACGSR